MKTIGIVGGTSWHSSIDYYRLINEFVNQRLGGNEAAQIILYSVNYGEIVTLTQQGDWDRIAAIICNAAWKIDRAGADCILLGANTMHKIAERVERSVSVPLLHIATETGRVIQRKGLQKVGLLGTKYTMELGFYAEKLSELGIETVLPGDEDRIFVNDVIYHELGKGLLKKESKERYLTIIDNLQRKGAEGIILGCTEIPMLIKQADTPIPVFDTTHIHAAAAVEFALG
ncbi:MAG: amino acid racemase [Terrimonas sp.]|nr:amino acid racemase [Terrimonas sp.]